MIGYGAHKETKEEMTYMLPRVRLEGPAKTVVDKGHYIRPTYTKSGKAPFSQSINEAFIRKGLMEIRVRLNFATDKDFKGVKS